MVLRLKCCYHSARAPVAPTCAADHDCVLGGKVIGNVVVFDRIRLESRGEAFVFLVRLTGLAQKIETVV